MAKTQEELSALKDEVEILNNKLKELTDKELKMLTGDYTVNEDGTYSFKKGEMYLLGSKLSCTTNLFEVAYDHSRVLKIHM